MLSWCAEKVGDSPRKEGGKGADEKEELLFALMIIIILSLVLHLICTSGARGLFFLLWLSKWTLMVRMLYEQVQLTLWLRLKEHRKKGEQSMTTGQKTRHWTDWERRKSGEIHIFTNDWRQMGMKTVVRNEEFLFTVGLKRPKFNLGVSVSRFTKIGFGREKR